MLKPLNITSIINDNIIRFSEPELEFLGSFNQQKTQVDFHECIFCLQMVFSLDTKSQAIAICQMLSQNNQISLLVTHQNSVSLWLEESGEFPDLSNL